MQKHLKKLISLTLATLLAFTCYVGYQEVSADGNGNAGHFNVDGDSAGWSHDNSTGVDVITISASGDYTISKDCDCTDAHEDYQIVIEGGLTVNLTIEDVQIEYDSGAPMDIDGTSNVTLTFEGDNIFTCSGGTYSEGTGWAGIQFNNGQTGSLTITSNSTDNTLTATGGYRSAGIGSSRGRDAYNSNNPDAYNITIAGGTVYAYGGEGGAGIGSARYGDAINISITGGVVYAEGGSLGGAGIGTGTGGWQGAVAGYGGSAEIVISGGTVYAYGHNGGSAIGSGNYCKAATVTITGGTVYAYGPSYSAAIGSGAHTTGDTTITITGGTVYAYGSNYYGGTGIGNGWKSTGNATITITGGNITASVTIDGSEETVCYAQAIGTTQNSTGSVTITIGTTNYEPYYYDDGVEYTYTTDSGEVVVISGNYVSFVVVPEVEESTTENSVIIVDTSTY